MINVKWSIEAQIQDCCECMEDSIHPRYDRSSANVSVDEILHNPLYKYFESSTGSIDSCL